MTDDMLEIHRFAGRLIKAGAEEFAACVGEPAALEIELRQPIASCIPPPGLGTFSGNTFNALPDHPDPRGAPSAVYPSQDQVTAALTWLIENRHQPVTEAQARKLVEAVLSA